MSLITFLKKCREKREEAEFKKAIENLRKSGFHTIRLDEELNFSFIKENNVLQFTLAKEDCDKKKRFTGFLKLIDELHGEHREFDVNGSRVAFWDI